MEIEECSMKIVASILLSPRLEANSSWPPLLLLVSSCPKTPRILMFLMSPSLCEVEVIEWWRKVVRNIDKGLRKKFGEGRKEI